MEKLHPMFRAASRPSFRPLRSLYRSSAIDFLELESELKSRRLPLLFSDLSQEPSYLLDQTLKSFLGPASNRSSAGEGVSSKPYQLPPGHHLVYFPNPTSLSQLLPDGTDTLHSPPPPFGQRLWAGGCVVFKKPRDTKVGMHRTSVLFENIGDVRVAGEAGAEKVFVGIERRILPGKFGSDDGASTRLKINDGVDVSGTLLYERRDLCFLRDDDLSLRPQPGTPRKVLAPPANPSFTFPMTPTQALLFRFSALTFNAHAIHIDPEYTRAVYGLPNLLVHGPLCLTLMLECLSRALVTDDAKVQRRSSRIREISYRNYKPLFVGEEMRICGKKKVPKEEKTDVFEEQWEVWIETGEGDDRSLAVRGTVEVHLARPSGSETMNGSTEIAGQTARE